MSNHNHKNKKNVFPSLRAVKLESFAHNWAETYPFIKRISLYLKPIYSDFDSRVKYVMHFEISDIGKTEGYGELGGYSEGDKTLDEDWIEALIKADNSWPEILESPNGLISALATTRDQFKEVYKNNPKDNFMDEWRFVTKLPKGIVEKYYWLLFSHSDKEKQSSPSFESSYENIKISRNTNGHSGRVNENSFFLKGDYWEVTFNGKKTSIQDLERIRYIIHLLDNPKIDMASHDLMGLVKGNIPEKDEDYNEMNQEQLEKEGLSFVEHNIEGLSKEEKDRLETMAYDQYNKLRDAQKKGKDSRIDEENKTWDNLKRHFLNEYSIEIRDSKKGLYFIKRKRLKAEPEKARINVSKNMKNAIDDIKKKLPALGTHLEKNISKGAKCCYNISFGHFQLI